VNAGTLTYWKWKLGSIARGERPRRGRPPRVPRPTFVELVAAAGLPLPPAEIPGEALEVVLGGGLRIRVPVRFDEDALRRVVAALGGQ
jgi:hypothetical protein